jgi:hypothetical protein
MNTTTKHEPTEVCSDVHCHSCHVDEPDVGAFIYCYECGHVYQTRWALKRAYLREALPMYWHDAFGPRPTGGITLHHSGGDDIFLPFTPPRFYRPIAAWLLVRSLFRRPSRISFCQECIHDF